MLRRPKRSKKAKRYFRGQMRKKEAKFELFGLQEANIPTLIGNLKERHSFDAWLRRLE